MSELRLLAIKTNAAVISICETMLDKTVPDAELNIEGYNVFRRDRNRSGGGVCFFVKERLSIRERRDLDSESIESIWMEILLPRTRPIVVGSIYRPPSQSYKLFIDSFENILAAIRPDVEVIVLGDFNINLKNESASIYKMLETTLETFSFTHLIKEPTRITKYTSTVLDIIICNHSQKNLQSGVIHVGISDHSLTFCTRKSLKYKFNQHKTIKIRSLKNYDVNIFNEQLTQSDWSPVLDSSDVDFAWCSLKKIFLSLINRMAPLKQVRLKQKSKEWMTPEILSAIKERDSLLNKFKNNPNRPDLYDAFRKLRNRIQKDIKKAKSECFLNKVEVNKNNPNKLWKCLKDLGYKNKPQKGSTVSLDVNGNLCHNESEVSNYFNKYFANIASDLMKKLPSPSNLFSGGSNAFKNYYNSKIKHVSGFSLEEIDESLIEEELRNLNPSKSVGLDQIPAKFLRDGAPNIKIPITHIINLSIKYERIPSDFKLAKVTPLHKKNSRTEANNYRPISILSSVSKILEKVVYIQVSDYLERNQLIYDHQSGFRRSFSTDTCLIHLRDHLRVQMSNGLFTGMVLLDVQKAFDSVNHDILCKKLKYLGCRSIGWFQAYLSGRNQIVDIKGTKSNSIEIGCEVPQDSLLGPLLFLVYVNDLPSSIESDCKVVLYADDCAIFYSHKDPIAIQSKLQNNLVSCNNWLIDNQLSLHMGKTECILFGSKRRLSKVNEFYIVCFGTTINGSKSIKYLGIEIDQNVSGDVIARSVINKANGRLKFLYRQSSFLNSHCRKILSFALIQPMFDYSVCSWSSTYRDCTEVKSVLPTAQSGVYVIKVIQNRNDGSVDFHRMWEDYKNGFGEVCGEYWLGNEYLHQLTSSATYDLRIDFGDKGWFAVYSNFTVGSEDKKYVMDFLSFIAGNKGDSFTNHKRVKFSTKDQDNDNWAYGECAIKYSGGWWFNDCLYSNLNGKFYVKPYYRGIMWTDIESTKQYYRASMKLRRT
ncbi:uncharacterized protein [Antedon mediterranea]|uniref:uncharacterized protein n=1 Tax=Antedon mediterranea TaxID=105859 RepID=UPI003AF9F99F